MLKQGRVLNKVLDHLSSTVSGSDKPLSLATGRFNLPTPGLASGGFNLSTPGLASGGFNLSTPGGSTRGSGQSFFPLPSFPDKIDNIASFYQRWDTEWRGMMAAHRNANRIYKWAEGFGKKHGAVMGKRWHVCKDFLSFMDGVHPPAQQKVALEVLEQFGLDNGVKHNIIVKKVFFHLANPLHVEGKEYKGLSAKLLTALTAAGFVIKQSATKQDHCKKRRVN
jgi:hypothetical protein